MITPPKVTLGGVTLSANRPVSWQITTGTRPFMTTYTVHKSGWDQLKSEQGKPLDLRIEQGGNTLVVRNVYILYEVQSDSPERHSFTVADLRWRWQYKMHARDYNIRRKTGEKFAVGDGNQLPQNTVTSDRFKYLDYSINQQQQRRWEPEEVLEDVLETLVADEEFDYEIESTSYKEMGEAQDASIENLQMRESGDVALGRALGALPGTDVYVNEAGKIIVFDASNYEESQAIADSLPPGFIDADRIQLSDKEQMRPSKVHVYYVREMECLFEYSENWVGTVGQVTDKQAFCDNVCATVDPKTTVDDRNTETGETVTLEDVPPGVFVPLRNWLEKMDEDRPQNSQPWDYESFSIHYPSGTLEAAWGAGAQVEIDTTANIAARVQNFINHFRRTWRINPSYMSRIRALKPSRVGIFNYATGQRVPSPVWQPVTIKPTNKHQIYLAQQGNIESSVLGRKVDYTPSNINEIVTAPGGPHRVVMVDQDLGIFRTEWVQDIYGNEATCVPGFLVKSSNQAPSNLTRNMALQDDGSVSDLFLGMRVESAQQGTSLKSDFEMYTMMTIVPSVPNNEHQFHRVTVEPDDIELSNEIGSCEGPEQHIFVAPGELTARFGMSNRAEANASLQTLLFNEGQEPPFEPGQVPPGYTLINEEQHLEEHAKAIAKQEYAPRLNAMIGRHRTTLAEDDDMKLAGSIVSRGIEINSQPSARVSKSTTFSGNSRPIDRQATLPYSVRSIILRTLE